MNTFNAGWYVIYTRPRHERKVAAELSIENIEFYLPITRVLRTWHDRKKYIDLPLFQSYIFVHLKNQEEYNVWTMKDPDAKKETRGTDGTVGFFCSWDSDNNEVGKGEQVIKDIKEGERIDIALHFIEPFEGDATAHMFTEPHGADQTKVTWAMKGKSKYPFNAMNLFIDNMLGKDMETSLEMLKANLEARK